MDQLAQLREQMLALLATAKAYHVKLELKINEEPDAKSVSPALKLLSVSALKMYQSIADTEGHECGSAKKSMRTAVKSSTGSTVKRALLKITATTTGILDYMEQSCSSANREVLLGFARGLQTFLKLCATFFSSTNDGVLVRTGLIKSDSSPAPMLSTKSKSSDPPPKSKAKKPFGFKRSQSERPARTGNKRNEWTDKLPKNFDPIEKCWVTVKVAEAKELPAMDVNGYSDPYVRILADDQRLFRTKTIQKSLDPSWMQEYHFIVPDGSKVIKYLVYDEDLLSGDDYIGEFAITLRDLKRKHKVDGWFKLRSKGAGLERAEQKKNRGSIRIRMECLTAFLLPKPYTQDLAALISEPAIADLVDTALTSKGPGAKKPIFRSIIAALHHEGTAVQYINNLVLKEIEETSSESIIFRKNTAASIVVDAYVNLLGFDLLQSTLGMHVASIYKDYKSSHEVDPTKCKDKSKLIRNSKRLMQKTDAIWQSILSSERNLPAPLREIFKTMREGVQKKWGDDTRAAYSAPSGFIFLRYFCPAILSPSLYGLAQDLPKPNSGRALKLISKILMTMANSTTFGGKEPYMTFANPFIDQNMDKLQGFIDKAVDPSRGGPKGSPKFRGHDVHENEAIAHVQSSLWNNIDELRKQPKGDVSDILINEITKLAQHAT